MRLLAIPEIALLQTFPKEPRPWRLAGRDDDARLRQLGNAVPPEMAHVLMKAMADVLAIQGGA